MSRIFTLVAMLPLIVACAATKPGAPDHKAHHPDGGAPAASAKPMHDMGGDMGAKMKSMHEMHQKMKAAKTVEERQALMAEHMKAMQSGMAMMKGMAGKDMPQDPQRRMQSIEHRMDMMQMMMDMMMDRMSAGSALPSGGK